MLASLVIGIITIIVMIIIMTLLAKFVLWLYTTAMTWTKVGFGLIIGLVCIQNVDPIVDNGILNYLIFSGIAFACIFLVSFLTRADCAIRFVSAFSVAWIVNGIYIGFASQIIDFFVDGDKIITLFNTWGTLITSVIALGFAIYMTINELRLCAPLFAKENSGIYVMADRIVASVIYGLFVGGVITLTVGIKTTFGFLLCAVVVGAAAFAADYFLLRRWIEATYVVPVDDVV